MKISQADLLAIVVQASTIDERLSDRFIPDPEQIDDKLINSRIEKWCQTVAKGDLEKFAKRLAWSDLELEKIRYVLGNICLAAGQTLPDWTKTLQEILLSELNIKNDLTDRCFDPKKPIPFEEVFLLLIRVARQKLFSQTDNSYQLVSEEAFTSLERSLLKQLVSICLPCLQSEFSIFRALKQSSLTSLLEQLQDSVSDELYQNFVNGLTTGRLLAFFKKYSVLARLVSVTIDFWVEATSEFIRRLKSDLPIIEQTFLKDTDQVVSIKPCLSDSHNQGRYVMALTFASGLNLIYKPKNLSLEVAYFKLLNWLNAEKSLLPLRLLKVINRSTHGWIEYVEHSSCEDEAGAERYYQRAGMLLCLVYILGGTDCHQENLIASGEHPVLIDIETLLHPRVVNFACTEEQAGAQFLATQQLIENSVLKVGLLPQWDFDADKQVAYDVSGLGGIGKQEISVKIPKWRHINTDKMELVHEPGTMAATIPTQTNAPSLNGITVSPDKYVEKIVDGFEQMYQFLMERSTKLLLSDSPLAALAHQRVRFVFRSTQVYVSILAKTLHPNFLRHGIDRSIELDMLKQGLLVAETKPPAWSLLRSEQQALEQLDIPYFIADSSSDSLTVSSDLSITGYFQKPSYSDVITNLQQLNKQSLVQQISLIRSSLCLRFVGKPNKTESSQDSKPHLSFEPVVSLTRSQMVQEAVAIAQELQQRAIYGTDGSVTWIGMQYIPGAEQLQLQPLTDSLYDGVCGVALFLAALSKITGNSDFRDLALGAVQQVRKNLQDEKHRSYSKIIKRIGIGGATGAGSIVYALVRISQFLNEPDLLDSARIIASEIHREMITQDRYFDLMRGTGGAILGLLALYQATLDPAILEQVTACGYHLLNNRVASNSAFRSWSTLDNELLTGFSHGAAGIAYALLRLYETTQELSFLKGAEEAIAYEQSVFSPIKGNWPDLRSFTIKNENSYSMSSWCHGATGIGLARLGSLMVIDTEEIRQDIAVALKTTQRVGTKHLDHLCCGNFGRIEMLLVAASELLRPELQKTAQKQAAQAIARAKQTGSFCFFAGNLRNVYNPGFFRGVAGIGYELLRLGYPDSLPSVLLWK
ncbi:type 2 lanthipeptide synthetase LanM family protein [Pleurocapsa sp. PCC 7319]|uniref:type 2 lanthipeptide synthetase LanM family protein n=1 Tax=Pleurocapsa sp. PCC 7319 TaxID=118161 RepID=UPI00034AE096|nr:type 2 lanthipeptide synthetase LanM family protein [Pleurocapsa sp. PCC 7319]